MFLKELIISSGTEIIREITFKKGLNLVMDTPITASETQSGNSVGKTTLFRAIDFCFGADVKDFYQDDEFKTDNEYIKKFLKDNEVNFCLVLKNIWSENAVETIFERKIGNNSSAEIFSINGQNIKDLKTYKAQIEKILFGIENSKPSLRQLSGKFIRKTTYAKTHVLKWLPTNTGKSEEYEIMHLFLLGFPNLGLLQKKLKLQTELREVVNQLKTLKQIITLTAAEQALIITNKEISKLENSIKTYNVGLLGGQSIEDLGKVRVEISELSSDISEITMKQRFTRQTVRELEKSAFNTDPDELKSIYEQATSEVSNIHKKFEEMVIFHQKMITNKLDFVKQSLESLNVELAPKEVALAELMEKQERILQMIGDAGLFDDLNRLYQAQNKLFEEKGKLEERILLIKKYSKQQQEITEKLTIINKEVNDSLDNFKSINLTTFNKYFSEYSQKFYGEQFLLSDGDTAVPYVVFKIDGIAGNSSPGKKKGLIAAFDLAYISFINDLPIDFPHFVCHDSYEDVHKNQLKTYFNIANQLNGQVITAILRDKVNGVMDESFLEANKILEIGEEDKFFKIENYAVNKNLLK